MFELKSTFLQRQMHPSVHCSIIHGGQDMETSGVPFDRRLGKEDGHTYTTEYYSAIRKDDTLPLVTPWMDLIMQSKISQKKLRTYDFTHM